LVKNIQAGCDLYKQAKESFVEIRNTANEVVAIGKEVKGFWGSLLKLFGGSPKPEATKSVAKAKRSDYVAVDETQVKADIVKNLSEFFKLQEQLEAAKKRWEEDSKNNKVIVSEENVAEVVSMMCGIPVTKVSQSETGKLVKMAESIRGKVIGQDEAVEKVVKAIQRNRAGLKDPNKPIGSFFF
jgi:ATP-dependent Clp protease ATP-binding subunit ClpA